MNKTNRADRKEVQKLRGMGFSQKEIGAKFGVCQQSIARHLKIIKEKNFGKIKILEDKDQRKL